MDSNFSASSVLDFMDYLGEKGLMNKTTAQSRKAACNNMFAILDENEKLDVRNIDLDSLSIRFANLKGKQYTPDSLKVYKSRVASAVADFVRYTNNPSGFTVGAKPKLTKKSTFKSEVSKINPVKFIRSKTAAEHISIDTFNIPIPLRAGCIIQINGIPTDLTSTEANKIANVVIALASEDKP